MSWVELLFIFVAASIGFGAVYYLLPSKKKHRQAGNEGSASPISSQAWYEVLEVDSSANLATITTAYRNKIHQYHPDRFANLSADFRTLAEARAKEINAAYDEAKREAAPN